MDIGGKKKVSIVLPVYNGETTIEKAIKSVIRQTYSNLELIIVNDCSTDGTKRIVERYAKEDERITLVNNTCNLKLPKTLNTGFAHASGKYYTWTSDDNVYKDDAIEKMVDILESDMTIDMVYANYTNIDANDREVGEVYLEEPHKLLTGNVIGACFLYTKRIAEQIGEYDPNLFLAEDYDYWIRIFRAGKILHIQDNLYYYRRHKNSLTETKKKQISEQTYKAMEKNFLFLYSAAKSRRERYIFFDQLCCRHGDKGLANIKNMLYMVDKGYLKYEYRKKIKERMGNITILKRV